MNINVPDNLSDRSQQPRKNLELALESHIRDCPDGYLPDRRGRCRLVF